MPSPTPALATSSWPHSLMQNENTTAGRAEDPSYFDIVWGQFRKRRLPFLALQGVIALFLIAVYAPLFISNKPFVLQVAGESLQSPWVTSLFDRNFFESSLDIAFNSLMFPGTVIFVIAVWRWQKHAGLRRRERAPRRRRIMLVAIAAWIFCLAAILTVSTGRPKTVYPHLQQRLVAKGLDVSAIYAPLPFSYRDIDVSAVRLPISTEHLLGTDNAGRDVFSRLVFGTRISLTVGLFAVALYITIGTALGAISGFYGGKIDIAIQRLIEVVISIPSLFLILTVAAFIEDRSIFHIMLIIAAVSWTTPARLVRAEFLRLKGLDYVAAATAAGFRTRTIIFGQILPNALGPVLVTATFGVASAILVESTMSFLGLGDITVPSWGQILNTGRTTGSWTLILAPGFAIFLTVSLLNMAGEGLRDALDPRLRK